MELRIIKPIENYLASSLINTINKVCSDIPSIDAVYLNIHKINDIKRTFIDINVLCSDIEDGYEIYHYFSDMIDEVNKKTNFNINFIPKESNLANDDSLIVEGIPIFDRYNHLLLLNSKDDDSDLIALEPPLQINIIKSWEQIEPSFVIKTRNQEASIINLYISSLIKKLVDIPVIMGIYIVKCFLNGYNRILIETIVDDEEQISVIEGSLKNEDLRIFINDVAVRVSLVFGTTKNYNYNFRSDKVVYENLNYLANGDIIFDRYGTLEELQDFCKSNAYQNYFKPLEYRVEFEPSLKLERIYNSEK